MFASLCGAFLLTLQTPSERCAASTLTHSRSRMYSETQCGDTRLAVLQGGGRGARAAPRARTLGCQGSGKSRPSALIGVVRVLKQQPRDGVPAPLGIIASRPRSALQLTTETGASVRARSLWAGLRGGVQVWTAVPGDAWHIALLDSRSGGRLVQMLGTKADVSPDRGKEPSKVDRISANFGRNNFVQFCLNLTDGCKFAPNPTLIGPESS